MHPPFCLQSATNFALIYYTSNLHVPSTTFPRRKSAFLALLTGKFCHPFPVFAGALLRLAGAKILPAGGRLPGAAGAVFSEICA
jgi:hypothetical protein